MQVPPPPPGIYPIGLVGSLWVPKSPTNVKWALVTDVLMSPDGLVRVTKSIRGSGFESVLIETTTLKADWRCARREVGKPPPGIDEDEYYAQLADVPDVAPARAIDTLVVVPSDGLPNRNGDVFPPVGLLQPIRPVPVAPNESAPSPNGDAFPPITDKQFRDAFQAMIDRRPRASKVYPPDDVARAVGVDADALRREDRTLLRWATTEALYGVARVRFRHLGLPAWADLDDDVRGGLFDQIEHYDVQRQWEPFPRGDTAADPADQQMLCDLANDLLGKAKGMPMGQVFKPRRGWASGNSAQAHDPDEVDLWARIGYAALVVKRRGIEKDRANFVRSTHRHGMGAVPRPVRDWDELHDDQKGVWREKAKTVATIASTSQIDAVRRCFLEHRIDPVFAGAIVGHIVFGGMSGYNPKLDAPE